MVDTGSGKDTSAKKARKSGWKPLKDSNTLMIK